MKFTADKKQFTKEIAKFIPFVERNTTIPILANLYFAVNRGTLTITATDLDNSLTSTFKVVDSEAGKITVPARKLADTLKKLSTLEAETITVSVKDKWVNLNCGALSVKLQGMEATNFPVIEQQPKDGWVSFPAKDLAAMIGKSFFALAKEESRYTLNGGLLIVSPQSIAMVTTDGHRLVHVEREVAGLHEKQETIIHRNTLEHLERLLDDDLVTFAKKDTLAFFTYGSYTLVGRIPSGKYPNWQAVMPRETSSLPQYTKTVALDSKQVAAALGRVSSFANERSMATRFALIPNEGLRLSASSSDTGEASELVKAEVADAITIGFDARYIQDVLKVMNGSGVTMKLRDEQSAGLFVPTKADDYKLSVVVMPVRL